MKRLIPWRRVRIAAWLALAGLLLAHPVAKASSDVFSNVGPGATTSGLSDRFALGNYTLDHHFDAVNASLTGGVDVSGVPALIAYFLADVTWQLTAFVSNAVITLFGFAFSLDLVNGSQATGGAGALAPVSQAVRSIYSSVFGAPWMVLAITAAGLWAMWKALVQRRYTETAGALGLSLIFTVIALAFVTQPERTIGQASRWTNQLSAAFLSLSNSGTLTDEGQARQQATDQLFGLLIYDPWAVLDFGGLQHCVKTPLKDPPESVAVRPLSTDPGRDAQLSGQLRDGTQVTADGKACVNDRNKYAAHFLAYPPESDDRDSEYDALNGGDSSKLPDSDPAKKSGSYQLSGVDKPAADAMGKGGQFQRLLLAVVILVGELGSWLLLGALSIGVILAQVLVLLLLAFAPVALVAGIYPGRGHDLFRGWLARLATFLVRKAIYSLILAVLLAVVAALQDATTNLGWLLSFGLQAVFLWAVFLYRHQLTQVATHATTGTEGARTERVSLPSLYWANRLTRAATQKASNTRPPSSRPPAPADPTPVASRLAASDPGPDAEKTGAEHPATGRAPSQGEPSGGEDGATPRPAQDGNAAPAAEAPAASAATRAASATSADGAPAPSKTVAPGVAHPPATPVAPSPARPSSPGQSPGSAPDAPADAQAAPGHARGGGGGGSVPQQAPGSPATPPPANRQDSETSRPSLSEELRSDRSRLRRDRSPEERPAPPVPPAPSSPPRRRGPDRPSSGEGGA